MRPVLIKTIGKESIFIRWDDGEESSIAVQTLRRFCPCATCSSFREGESKNFIPLYFHDQLTITKLTEVGNYAVSISWKDGHNTGIYEFPYLKSLANK